ncbi:MAG: hypothetical protein KC435_00420 [Thermomicrobiales bacterium]|nr:hypothetical protein [Thermomicrobiales bacterium]
MRLRTAASYNPVVSKRLKSSLVLLCLAIVLASCGSSEDDGGPQFVNDPRPTSTVSATATTAPTAPPTATAAATQSASRLLDTRSAPRFVYLTINDVLTSYDTANRVFTTLDVSEDMSVVDYAASPTGDRVGILAVRSNRLVVQFYGADGAALSDFILLSVPPVVQVQATPESATPVVLIPDRSDQMHIDWVPQGNAVIVSGPGVSQHVSMSGAVMPISRTGTSGDVVRAIWSPMDSQIAIQTRTQNGDQRVYMLDMGHDEATELDLFSDESGMVLSNLQWLPSGLGLVVVAGTLSDGVVMHGQLYVYRFADEEPTMLATSGQGGPNATITHAAVSPDGHSVVYAVMVNDAGGWYLHSLWVKSIKGGPAVEIPTTSAAPITSLQWSDEGVIWQQADGTLMVVGKSLEPRPLGTEPQATPVSTPQATPVNDTPVG